MMSFKRANFILSIGYYVLRKINIYRNIFQINQIQINRENGASYKMLNTIYYTSVYV